jgi:hypothetical protein
MRLRLLVNGKLDASVSTKMLRDLAFTIWIYFRVFGRQQKLDSQNREKFLCQAGAYPPENFPMVGHINPFEISREKFLKKAVATNELISTRRVRLMIMG